MKVTKGLKSMTVTKGLVQITRTQWLFTCIFHSFVKKTVFQHSKDNSTIKLRTHQKWNAFFWYIFLIHVHVFANPSLVSLS